MGNLAILTHFWRIARGFYSKKRGSLLEQWMFEATLGWDQGGYDLGAWFGFLTRRGFTWTPSATRLDPEIAGP